MSDFTQYNSPNIVIVPTKSVAVDSSQKSKSEADSKSPTDETNKSIPILIQGITSNSEPCSDTNSYANMSAKNKNWGSNFLQNIGLPYEKNRRESMNNSQENARFQHQDPSLAPVGPHQFVNVNLQTAAPNISYTYVQSSSIPGTTYTNYNKNTGVLPAAYPLGSFENNNYYYGQPINATESGCCSTCCGMVVNIPNTYMNTYNQSSNVGNNSSLMTYYNTNATSNLAPSVNLLHSQSYAFINSNTQSTNNFSQPVNLSGYNTNTSQTPCEDTRCPTPLIDENLLTPQLNTYINANSTVTKLTELVSSNIDEKQMATIDSSKIEETICECTCSKRNPNEPDKLNLKIQNNADKEIEQISSVQANEKAFREFLRKLKIDRPSEKEKKQNSPFKSPSHSKKLKKSKTKSKENSSVQENEKAFRKLLQKLKMEYKSETAKSDDKHIGKNTSKSTTTSNEKTKTYSENKGTKDPEQNEKERPKFIKTKYVDKQEPEYKPIVKARLHDYDKYSKTKTITTKYVDKQELYYKHLKKSKLDVHEMKKHSKSVKYLDDPESECRPIRKAKYDSDYGVKTYSTAKTIPTKYVDEQEPEYKPLKKAKYESDYLKAKYVGDRKREYKQIKKTRIESSEFTKRSTPEYDVTNYKVKRSREESDSSDDCCKKYKSDYKIKTFKSESTKYYKYKSENDKESRKQTPVKSVVKISKTCELKKSPLYNSIDKEDLRDKLSRKLHATNKEHEEDISKRKPSEESNENLIITVNNNVTENKNSPSKLTDQLKTKTDSCKKINLVINIVYKQPGSRRESEKRESESHSPQANVDLSFLDDFNVDEIVASLNKTENVSMHQNSQSETSNFASSSEGGSKVDTSNVFIVQDNLEISKAKIILEKGDVLNNFLSTESSILDTLRNMDEEIKNEKRLSMNNEQNISLTEIPIPKDDKCANTMHKKEIREETVFNQSVKEQIPLLETKNVTENTIISSVCTSLSPLSVLMEHIKKIDTPHDLSQPINYGLLQEETITLTENNMNSYEHGLFSFDVEDKRKQTELLKVLEDTKEDEKTQTKTNSTLQTVHVMDNCSNHTSENTTKKVFLDNVSNDIKTYNEVGDKRRQSKLIKVLDETKDDLGLVQMKVNTVLHGHTFRANDSGKECSKLTIIDISSDDSDDSCTTKQSKDKYSDDVYIVEEKSGKNVIETIDLTTVENLDNQVLTPSVAKSKALNRRENKPVSYNPDVKENKETITTNEGLPNMDILANGKQKQISSIKLLSKERVSDICVNNNECIDTGTQITQKIVTAIKDAIDSLKSIENLKNAVDKSNKDETKALPINSQKETLHIANNEVHDMSLNQIMIQQNQYDTQPSNTVTISMEDKTNSKKAWTEEINEMKEKEKYASVPITDNIVNFEIENGTHETMKNHVNLKENVDIKLTKKQINTIEETISDEASNMRDEESVVAQAEVDGKNENSLYKHTELENMVNKISMEDCTTADGKNENSSYKDTELENSINKISKEDCTTAVTTERIVSCDKQQKNSAPVVNNVDPQIVESKAEVNADDKKITTEEGKFLKGKVQNKTDTFNPKIMPSTVVTTINTPSPTIKNDKPNLKAVDVKVDNAHKKSPTLGKDQKISKIAGNLEREMLNCFNQNYTANGLIHSGTFSKIFHFTSYSGLQYAVKSYNDSQSIYKYADRKDMMFALQEGLMRYSYGGVFLINSFSLQGRLCLLMDYYPKNLKQALAENEKPFHINVVQHLARQLVSAVMLLKSHDVVHLDIKPTHILLNHKNKKLKLCGFDAARQINKIAKLPNLGTVNYRPPEVIVGYKIGFDVDVWATALVLYEMATGTMLFPGIYNNDILFKQMCTLGALPVEMLNRAHFSHAHFTGCSFKRIMGKKGNKINIITKFYKTKRLETTIIKAYNDNWRSSATEQQFMVDKEKIMSFTALLREMLNVDPGERMPIQFVDTHSFVTNEW